MPIAVSKREAYIRGPVKMDCADIQFGHQSLLRLGLWVNNTAQSISLVVCMGLLLAMKLEFNFKLDFQASCT